MVQAINRFDFTAPNITTRALIIGVFEDIFENITRITLFLGISPIILGLIGLNGVWVRWIDGFCRILCKNRH